MRGKNARCRLPAQRRVGERRLRPTLPQRSGTPLHRGQGPFGGRECLAVVERVCQSRGDRRRLLAVRRTGLRDSEPATLPDTEPGQGPRWALEAKPRCPLWSRIGSGYRRCAEGRLVTASRLIEEELPLEAVASAVAAEKRFPPKEGSYLNGSFVVGPSSTSDEPFCGFRNTPPRSTG